MGFCGKVRVRSLLDRGKKIEMLTAKADEGSSELMDDLFSTDDQCNDVFLDLDSFWRVMGAPSEPSQVIFHPRVYKYDSCSWDSEYWSG